MAKPDMPTSHDAPASPRSTQTADSAGRLLEAMQRYWGYDAFRPLQAEAMQAALADRDSLVVLPTGGGKSLCFQAPAATMEGVALVVSPLISLMKDQVDALRQCGVPAAAINSTLTPVERREIAADMRSGKLKLVYVAPERLLGPRTLEYFQSFPISLVAVDEAHCISHWGHDFRPEYRGLSVLKEAFPGVGVHAYTATASAAVREDIVRQLGLVDPCVLVGSFDRPNLVYRVRRSTGRFAEVSEIAERRRGESGIVYCISRKEVETTAAGLSALGIRAAPYHAGMSDDQRHRNQDAFLEESVDVVVATVAFGMGIDKSNVRYVVHAGMPKSLEHYVQESGRAGRDGLEAECVLLFNGSDAVKWRRMIETGENAAAEGALAALEAMEQFCHSAACRHGELVAHFGQRLDAANCSACDVCLGEVEFVEEPLVLGQKILSCVARLEERYGADYTAKVLAGSREERILSAGHNTLSTYGLLAAENVASIRRWIDQLASQRYLQRSGEFNVLQLTDLGRELLRGNATPQLLKPGETAEKSRASRSRRYDAAQSWEGVDRGLFERLRQVRAETAAERGVPPYLVFGDASLRDMARKRPGTTEAFLTVHGVGQQKRAEFGERFVGAIGDYCREAGLATDIVVEASADRRPAASAAPAERPSAGAAAAFEHFRRGATVSETMAALGRARSTVAGYLAEFLRSEGALDPAPWVDPDLARRIESAIEKAGLGPLKPIFDALGGEVAYDDIRLVAVCVANRDAC
jgi:ATP-dependent DNA helicase RecQ